MAAILVVDDHAADREFLTALLGRQGHRVTGAADAGEALRLIRAQRPDLVLAKIPMPPVDGSELVRQIRADPAIADTRVIFRSATHSERELRELAQACGVAHILTRPCEPAEVLRVVEAALGISTPATELAVANQRLAALIEVSLQLASETDSRRLLENVCRAARELIGAKYAMVGVNSGGKALLEHFITSGMDEQTAHDVGTTLPYSEVLGMILTRRRACRINHASGGAQALGFPAHFPPVRSFLGAPIVSASQIYGWLCLAERIGRDAFTEEDERIATSLAAQVGRAYENRGLYLNLQRKAGELEREVAERRQAEAAVKKLNDELERRVLERTADLQAANDELEAFSYSISHDLRAPLRHIDGFLDLLGESLGSTASPEQKRHLYAVTEASGRMTRLIDALLSFSRTNRAELRPAAVDLEGLVGETLHKLKPDLDGRNIEWIKSPLPEVRGDRALLSVALVNLLSNAIKYTRPRDPARIEIGCAGDTAAETVIFVRDNGVGFDMDHAENLFGVFQRLHLAEEFEGTGIGLASVRRIILRHGGRAWAEARIDQGATFYFSLPKTGRTTGGYFCPDPPAGDSNTQRKP